MCPRIFAGKQPHSLIRKTVVSALDHSGFEIAAFHCFGFGLATFCHFGFESGYFLPLLFWVLLLFEQLICNKIELQCYLVV